MAEELLLKEKTVYPERLLKHGFSFSYPSLFLALEHEWE